MQFIILLYFFTLKYKTIHIRLKLHNKKKIYKKTINLKNKRNKFMNLQIDDKLDTVYKIANK